MVRTHKDVLRDALKDEEIRREYEALDPEYELRRALIKFRKQANVTQQELAERLGTKQEYISRIERGNVSLTYPYLVRLMNALGADVEITLKRAVGEKPDKGRVLIK